MTHGLVLVRNQVKRRTKRGHSYVNRRTHEGQDALKLQAGLVDDQVGIDNVSTATFIAIQELPQLYYLGAMMDQSIAKFIREHPEAKNARSLARMFSYRMPVSTTIAKYLTILGLEKTPPPAKTLAEILAENEPEAQVLLYHMVFPANHRRAVFDEVVDGVVRDVCLEIEKRNQIKFLEIGGG